MKKKKLIAFIIFVLVGQITAFGIWKLFNADYFLAIFLGSISGFFVAYKNK